VPVPPPPSKPAVVPSPAAPASPVTTAPRIEYRTPTAWGTDLPGITTTGVAGHYHPTVSLTFDACGGEGGSLVDVALLDTLRREEVPATLFLNARWVRANQKMAAELAADPLFEIGNHGTRHVPLSVTGRAAYGIGGTTDVDDAIREVVDNQQVLADVTGIRPTWFRAGTAHYDDVAVDIVSELGLSIAGFTVNGDAGATLSPPQVAANLADAPDGAIVLMHMNQPFGGSGAGLRAGLPRLRERGVRFAHLPGAGQRR